jgi:hypothetical protein
MEDLEKIAVLENEIEGRMLDAMLTERGIPHVMRSYYDDAYDGLFQTTKGWGHVLAPPAHRDEIVEILEELRQGGQPSEGLDP